MTTAGINEEVRAWVGDDAEREALMISEAPIAESTLKATIAGRYNPGRHLTQALRALMARYPAGKPLPKRTAKAAV